MVPTNRSDIPTPISFNKTKKYTSKYNLARQFISVKIAINIRRGILVFKSAVIKKSSAAALRITDFGKYDKTINEWLSSPILQIVIIFHAARFNRHNRKST